MNVSWYDQSRFIPSHGRNLDRMVFVGTCVAALVASSILALITLFLISESWPFLSDVGVLRLLSDEEWAPKGDVFGLAPMLVSSVLLTIGALLLTTPFSIGFAVYCSFYSRKRIAAGLLRLVDISAGIPTVIYGFWGLVVVVPIINSIAPPGASILAGILVLSLMIFPTITVITQAAIEAVPKTYIYASTALGVGRAATIRHIVFRQARAGVLAAMTLGAARAIGETIVVLMVCGNVVQMPSSFFDPVRTLTANIALEMQYAMGLHQAALYATGLTVLMVVALLVLLSGLYAQRQAREDS